MTETTAKEVRTKLDSLTRLVRVARGLEAIGSYNASKLFWGLAFSRQIRASRAVGIPAAGDELDAEIGAALEDVKDGGASPAIVAAIVKGRERARENATIPMTEIPAVAVCRTCGELFLGEPPEKCPTCGAHKLTMREFLPVYFLEPFLPVQALAALGSAPDELENAIQGLNEEQMARKPAQNEWAVRDIFTHLLVAQGLLAGRVVKILAEENPSLTGVAAWAIGNEDTLAPSEVIARYRKSREETVARLKGIAFADWWRTARHEEFGQITLLQQASYFAKHDRAHLPQIREIRKAIGAAGA
jgi:hypothetical protein